MIYFPFGPFASIEWMRNSTKTWCPDFVLMIWKHPADTYMQMHWLFCCLVASLSLRLANLVQCEGSILRSQHLLAHAMAKGCYCMLFFIRSIPANGPTCLQNISSSWLCVVKYYRIFPQKNHLYDVKIECIIRQ